MCRPLTHAPTMEAAEAKKAEKKAWEKVKKICGTQSGGAVQMLFFCILIKT